MVFVADHKTKLDFPFSSPLNSDCGYFLGIGKNFDYLCNLTFLLPTFNENFIFLKNCPNEFHEILHSQSTLKGACACAMASKSYDWVCGGIPEKTPRGLLTATVFHFCITSTVISSPNEDIDFFRNQ